MKKLIVMIRASFDNKNPKYIFMINIIFVNLIIAKSAGSGNGLVPSGNKPLPEPMLTQIYDAIKHH